MKEAETADTSKILCPFCSAPWTDENIKVYDLAYEEYESTGPYNHEVVIEISCHKCKRLMYKKEGLKIE